MVVLRRRVVWPGPVDVGRVRVLMEIGGVAPPLSFAHVVKMEGRLEEAIGLVGSLQALLNTPASSADSSKKPEGIIFEFICFFCQLQ